LAVEDEPGHWSHREPVPALGRDTWAHRSQPRHAELSQAAADAIDAVLSE